MKAIEFETRIEKDGSIHVPPEFQEAYGQLARLVVLLRDESDVAMTMRKPGSAKGILRVIVEDDEHLSDFQEYMH